MNFKTIFSIAVLALAAVNASPIDEISRIKRECESDNKASFYYNKSTGEYTCFRHEKKERDLDYRTCFFINEYGDNVVCVEEGFNNIPSCSKNSGANDYYDCAKKFLEMVDDGSDKLPYRIRKFPTHEKIFRDFSIDHKECKGHDGVLLSYKASFQYICLEPVIPGGTLKDKECALVDGKVHCVYQDNTSIDHCVKRSKYYDHEACKGTLREYGIVNHYNVTSIN